MQKESFLSEFFSLVRKERKGQKEECFPLLNTFCRLAATGANTLPRPSDYSIAAATGSKRSSADSDSLLCHVGLWRTSRLKFGCVSGCEHSEMGFILIVPSAQVSDPRCPVSATPTHMLRICVNSPTMRVVDGADPSKIKLKYSQQKKQKICTLSRRRAY